MSAKKLMQYDYNETFRGIQIEITLCAYTKKDVMAVTGKTTHFLNNWMGCYEPQDECCIKNPLQLFARFNGGELGYVKPEWRNKVMPLKDLQDFIEDHRKSFKTYRDTLKHYSPQSLK